MADVIALASNEGCEALQRELANSQIPQDTLNTALYRAIDRNQEQAIGILLSNGACLTKLGFLAACRNFSIPTFRALADNGWDVNSLEFGGPALRLVVDDAECVKWLLQHGADPNLNGIDTNGRATPSILATAALSPSVGSLKHLISSGAKADPEALFRAIDPRGRSTIATTQYLIEAGIDVNARNPKLGTPLIYATRVGNVDKVKLLLATGAHRSATNSQGQTAADVAKEQESHELLQILSD